MGCHSKHNTPISLELKDHWEFKAVSDTIWSTATVPGNVHSDLLDNELIKHPFIADNIDKQQWISDTDWEYRTTFPVQENILKRKSITLNFQGLDSYANVFLNDSLILQSNNAFISSSVDVKSILKPSNKLHIVFERTSISEEKKASKLNYQLPESPRVFTRKAQFQYGWDWGPKMNTFGIWQPITITAWDDFKINNTYVKQSELNDSVCDLVAQFEYNSKLNKELNCDVYLNDSLVLDHRFHPLGNTIGIPFQIKNPRLWWPHNLGTPYLYNIKVVIRDNQNVLDSVSLKKGLRTITLVTEKDSIGSSFYFMVNGIPVFMKGANYIPQNSMQNRVNSQHYENLLDNAVNANMNMLRVWGGGIYENDTFYNLCDEKGVLVWQDFMFACAMYPGNDAFLKNVSKEAKQQVKRLRNHASIALWCGNNESAEGWHRWGWQNNRSTHEKDEIWTNYLKVFDSILPMTVKQFTNTDYWESSPKYGRGNPKYKTEGDAHDWWVWHDAYPFEHFEENIPRFMSEFGFQGFPSYDVVRYINQKDSIDIDSPPFKTHQKHSRGFQLINVYMKRDFPIPESAEDYIYVSQLLQAYGIGKGIEAHRRAKPHNMGSLFWQLNDCWPSVSWSSVDFYGNWKALHYKAKKSFANLIISNRLEDNLLKTYLINDTQEGIANTLKIKIMDFNGNTMWEYDKKLYVGTENKIAHELDLNTLPLNKDQVVVVSSFGETRNYFYLEKPKHLKLKKASIEQNISKSNIGFQITLRSTTLQKNVFLYCRTKGHFSDNYFDLMPNETLTIEFSTSYSDLEDLKIKTLNNLMD
jgi:beta-mannosidase